MSARAACALLLFLPRDPSGRPYPTPTATPPPHLSYAPRAPCPLWDGAHHLLRHPSTRCGTRHPRAP
eukprot:876331-Prymnesium_polylepis.1